MNPARESARRRCARGVMCCVAVAADCMYIHNYVHTQLRSLFTEFGRRDWLACLPRGPVGACRACVGTLLFFVFWVGRALSGTLCSCPGKTISAAIRTHVSCCALVSTAVHLCRYRLKRKKTSFVYWLIQIDPSVEFAGRLSVLVCNRL